MGLAYPNRGGGGLTQTAADAAYQPLDSDLTDIAALTTASFGRSLLTFASGVATQAGIGLVSAVASADVVVSDTTFAALLSVSLEASARYYMEAEIHYTSSATSDGKMVFGVRPSGLAGFWSASWVDSAITALAEGDTLTLVGASARRAVKLSGLFSTSSAGTMTLQGAENVDAATFTAHAGSMIRFQRLS